MLHDASILVLCLQQATIQHDGAAPHLVVIEHWQFKVALLAGGHLAFAVHEPRACQQARQIRPFPDDLIVHADAAAPAAEAALLGVAQAQQRCTPTRCVRTPMLTRRGHAPIKRDLSIEYRLILPCLPAGQALKGVCPGHKAGLLQVVASGLSSGCCRHQGYASRCFPWLGAHR